MALNRDAIFQALMERVRAIDEFVIVDDRMRGWASVTPGEQPAAFIIKGGETPVNDHRGLPPKWTITARIYVYAHSASRMDMSGQRQINLLLTKIEAALERQPDEGLGSPLPFATTLGGLVSHAWIGGTVETDEGTLGDQSVAIVPVEMLATG